MPEPSNPSSQVTYVVGSWVVNTMAGTIAQPTAYSRRAQHPNRKYLPQKRITIPNTETIDTLYLGTLGPEGLGF